MQCNLKKYTEFLYYYKGTATPLAHIDPIFNLRFWRIWG